MPLPRRQSELIDIWANYGGSGLTEAARIVALSVGLRYHLLDSLSHNEQQLTTRYSRINNGYGRL